MNVTHFGEIVELDSRAVWYSDEEDDDDSIDDDLGQSRMKSANVDLINSHETMRSKLNIKFRRSQRVFPSDIKFTSCIISQASKAQFENFKLDPTTLLGYFDNIGKAIICPAFAGQTKEEHVLWLLFNSSAQLISGQEVGYFVEKLRGLLYSDFNLNHSLPIIIISQRFSSGDHLEYLLNYSTNETLYDLPFHGSPIGPPSLIANHFESAIFEQLTLTLKPALIVCLPNPKNFWFDKTLSWPTAPNKIIELRLSDDHLEKTLIFT